MANIRIQAKEKDGMATVKTLMKHPMETGLRKDKETGKEIPAHYITEVTCEHQGQVVVMAYLGRGVSKNPYVSFEVKNGKKGDTVKISWVDNRDDSASAEAQIK